MPLSHRDFRCPACGHTTPIRNQRANTISRHDRLVLEALIAKPDASWREIYRATGLDSTGAKLARERLLASGHIVLDAASKGPYGARYRVVNPDLPLPSKPDLHAHVPLRSTELNDKGRACLDYCRANPTCAYDEYVAAGHTLTTIKWLCANGFLKSVNGVWTFPKNETPG